MTITPTKSTQTVSCAGKKMSGNIVVNPIPANFVDIQNGATFFNNGAYGPFAPSGAESCRWTNTVTDIKPMTPDQFVNFSLSSGNTEKRIEFVNFVPVDYLEEIKVVISAGQTSGVFGVYARLYNTKTGATRSSDTFWPDRDYGYVTNTKETITISIPEGLDPKDKWQLQIRKDFNATSSGNGYIYGITIHSIIGYGRF